MKNIRKTQLFKCLAKGFWLVCVLVGGGTLADSNSPFTCFTTVKGPSCSLVMSSPKLVGYKVGETGRAVMRDGLEYSYANFLVTLENEGKVHTLSYWSYVRNTSVANTAVAPFADQGALKSLFTIGRQLSKRGNPSSIQLEGVIISCEQKPNVDERMLSCVDGNCFMRFTDAPFNDANGVSFDNPVFSLQLLVSGKIRPIDRGNAEYGSYRLSNPKNQCYLSMASGTGGAF